MNVSTDFTHLIQEFYESLQARLIKALNVCFQLLVAEKFAKERLIAAVGGVEARKPLLGIRNLGWHIWASSACVGFEYSQSKL